MNERNVGISLTLNNLHYFHDRHRVIFSSKEARAVARKQLFFYSKKQESIVKDASFGNVPDAFVLPQAISVNYFKRTALFTYKNIFPHFLLDF